MQDMQAKEYQDANKTWAIVYSIPYETFMTEPMSLKDAEKEFESPCMPEESKHLVQIHRSKHAG